MRSSVQVSVPLAARIRRSSSYTDTSFEISELQQAGVAIISKLKD